MSFATTPVGIFKSARQNPTGTEPGPGAHAAERLAWHIGQPDAFARREQILEALNGIEGFAREQLAAACEAKLFPNLNSRTGLTRDKMAMLQMLQSIHAGR